MPDKPDEKEPAFKVVDRRRFTEDGEKNSESDATTSREQIKAENKKTETESFSTSRQRPEINFSFFVQSLAHQAMMGLGMVPWPDSGLVRKELVLAKETIDILQILKEKTAGNLSKDESVLLESIVYQLKMAYVEIAQTSSLPNDTIIK